MAKKRRVYIKKMPFGVTDEFVESVEKLSVDDRKKLVFELHKDIENAKSWLNTKEEVVAAKIAYDLLAGPTRDSIRSLRNRSAYIIDQMKLHGEI